MLGRQTHSAIDLMATRKSKIVAATRPEPRPSKGTPLHRQVFLVLRDEIAQQVHEGGTALPREESLCERFGVSRITVRRALAELAALGLVDRRQGVGTFVSADTRLTHAVPSLGLVEYLKQSQLEAQVSVLGVERRQPPRDVATLLHIEPGEKAVNVLRSRSIDDVPVMLTDAWVSARLAAKITPASLRRHALYELLMIQGVRFGRVIQEISGAVANQQQAETLKVELASPLLKMVRLMHGQNGEPVLYITIYVHAETSRIVMDIPGESTNTLSGGQLVHDVRSRSRRR